MKILLTTTTKNQILNKNHFLYSLYLKSKQYVPFNLTQIAAVTPLEHKIDIICENNYNNPINFSTDYDLVGISTITPFSIRAYQIADKFRKKNIPVVFGGYHPSSLPEEAKQHADSVVVGEAELSWPKLLNDFQNGDLKPYYYQKEPIDPKKILPPRRDLIKHYISVGVQATRGCPNRCEFCAIQNVEGHVYRKRPIENVISEIKTLKRSYFSFYDPSLTIDTEYTKSLFKEMIGLNKKFDCNGTINVLYNDEELIKLSQKAGCQMWQIGFESICQDSLDSVKKANKVKNYASAIKMIRKNGIAIKGLFVFGFGGDTPEIFKETLKVIKEWKIDDAQFAILTPFPGTNIFKRFEEEGRILTKDWSQYNLGNVVYQPKKMSPEMLFEGTTKIAHTFFSYRNIFKRALDDNLDVHEKFNKLYCNVADRLIAIHEQGLKINKNRT